MGSALFGVNFNRIVTCTRKRRMNYKPVRGFPFLDNGFLSQPIVVTIYVCMYSIQNIAPCMVILDIKLISSANLKIKSLKSDRASIFLIGKLVSDNGIAHANGL